MEEIMADRGISQRTSDTFSPRSGAGLALWLLTLGYPVKRSGRHLEHSRQLLTANLPVTGCALDDLLVECLPRRPQFLFVRAACGSEIKIEATRNFLVTGKQP